MISEMSLAKPKPSTATIISWIGNVILAILAVTLGALYIQASQNLEAQKATVAVLQMEIAKEASNASELKSDLNAARTDVQTLAARSALLKSEVENKEQDLAAEKFKAESVQAALDQEKARLPAVPIRIQMRPSALSRGLVAMFTNTSARHLSVLMATRNPTTQVVKQLSLQVVPGSKVEIGFREGVQFASGDQLILRSAGYEELRYTVQ
jgi:septal ring factor EnvC (AmiA/AmiB activator)